MLKQALADKCGGQVQLIHWSQDHRNRQLYHPNLVYWLNLTQLQDFDIIVPVITQCRWEYSGAHKAQSLFFSNEI